METEDINHWADRIAAKLFNEYVTSENYTKEKAVKALSRCVGSTFLTDILNQNESIIISKLISESERTY